VQTPAERREARKQEMIQAELKRDSNFEFFKMLLLSH